MFQVSYPREPLENYDISSNTVGTSTNAAIDYAFHQGLNRIHIITTSPLNFANLLWKSKVILSIHGIIEYYCWIRRRSSAHHATRASLEPAYQVNTDWNEYRYTVTRLSQHPRI
jgi:hypothetical protein